MRQCIFREQKDTRHVGIHNAAVFLERKIRDIFLILRICAGASYDDIYATKSFYCLINSFFYRILISDISLYEKNVVTFRLFASIYRCDDDLSARVYKLTSYCRADAGRSPCYDNYLICKHVRLFERLYCRTKERHEINSRGRADVVNIGLRVELLASSVIVRSRLSCGNGPKTFFNGGFVRTTVYMDTTMLKKETENLKYMWNRHSASFLASYLPKNLGQSRPFYTRKSIMNYLALKNPDTDFEREERFIRPVVVLFLRKLPSVKKRARSLVPFFTKRLHDLFLLSSLMRSFRLKRKALRKASIVDIGCGAGNYYRMLEESGLSTSLDYHGIDIAEKNIEICKTLYPRARYPTASFSVGDICNMEFPERSFDIVMVNSVLEHLSLDALPTALSEVVRVAKDLIIINFFNEQDVPDHTAVPQKRYYWNCLSRRRVIEILRIHGIQTENITVIDRYPPFACGAKIRYNDPAMGGRPFSLSTMVIKNRNMKTAVILAAGLGSRLYPHASHTETLPKCLLEVGNMPILHRQLSALEKNDVTDVVIVVGFKEEAVREYVSAYFPKINIVFVTNIHFASTNTLYSLALAAEQIKEGSEVFLLNGDVVFDDEIIRRMITADPTKSHIAANRAHCGEEEIKIKLATDGTVALLNKKIDPAEALGESVGINKFSTSFWGHLADNLQKLKTDFSHEYFEFAVEKTTLTGEKIYPLDITGLRVTEIDFPDDLERARLIFAA